MKKLIITLLAVMTTASGFSQTIGEAFYVYRNDGEFNVFFRDEVDSIAYSNYDEDSLYYDEIVCQIVYTVDSIYRIPLSTIDSISFVTPETKYTPQVVKMEPLLPYITEVDGMTLTFSTDLPLNMLPQKDDILVLDNFSYEQFPTGFAGRMISKNGQQIICDSVSFEDIYEQIICYGRYTAIDDSPSENGRMRFAARKKVEGNLSTSVQVKGTLGTSGTGLYATLDGRAGLDLRFTFKYNTGEPVYFDISLAPEFSLSFEAGIQGSFNPEPLESKVPLLLIPIPDTPFYFKVNGGPILEAAAKASVVAKTDAKLGYKFGVKYENGSFKGYGSNTSKWFSKPDITGSIDGSVFLGLKLESGIYSYGEMVKIVIEKKAGPEIEASISENIKNPNSYEDLCDDHLDVNLKASAAFKAEAKIFKWVKLSAKHDILSGKFNVLRYKIVPTFTKPSVSIDKMSASVSVIPNEKMLFPVSIGLGLWDHPNEIPEIHICEEAYSNKDDWSLNEYNTIFTDLAPITEYTVRPIVKLFDGTIVASPEESFKIPIYPVTLDVYDIGHTSAKVYGKIEGLNLINEKYNYGIGYSTEGESGKTLFNAMDDYGSGVFSVNLMSLKPNTVYNCFAFLEIGGEYIYGRAKQFRTDSEPEAYYVWDEENKTTTYYYDGKCKERGGVNMSNPGWIYDPSSRFHVPTASVKVIYDSSFSNYHPTFFTFQDCDKLKKIENLKYLNTDKMTSMDNMFINCSSLTSIDLSHFNTSNVTSMCGMFSGCSSLTILDLSSFNTDAVTLFWAYYGNRRGLFEGCSSLTHINLSSFCTSNVACMDNMFARCSSLTSLDLSSFDISNTSSMNCMFMGCNSLTNINLSGFKTSGVDSMKHLFMGCSSLVSIDLSSFNPTKWFWTTEMFAGCTSLNTIFAGNWFETNSWTNIYYDMFIGCTNLVGGQGTKIGKNLYAYDENGNPLYYYCEENGRAAHIDGGKDNPGLFTAK